MFKSNKGFTLVELIVVIAILAILAGVAIPVYNGYIKRAQDAAVVTELDAIATAAQAANATVGQIDLIVVTENTIKVSGPNNADGDSVLAKGFNDDFGLFYPNATGKGTALGIFSGLDIELKGSYEEGAYWEGGEWHKGENTDTVENIEASIGTVVIPDGDINDDGDGTTGDGTTGDGTTGDGTTGDGTTGDGNDDLGDNDTDIN